MGRTPPPYDRPPTVRGPYRLSAAVASVPGMTELAELVLTPDERARGVGVDRVALVLDWSGEDEPGQLAAFVAGRVAALGADPVGVDDAAVRHAAAHDPTLERGDLLVRQFDHLAGALAGRGCTILTLVNGADCYEVLVARTEGREPAGLTHEGVRAVPWGTELTVVSLDCPGCAQNLCWEQPADDPLADSRCDCGEVLFDADGRPLPGVVLDD